MRTEANMKSSKPATGKQAIGSKQSNSKNSNSVKHDVIVLLKQDHPGGYFEEIRS